MTAASASCHASAAATGNPKTLAVTLFLLALLGTVALRGF
jgi:hypothetical protein